MKLEHVAFLVDDPDAVAKWYCDHLGMKLVRQGPPPVKMRFLVDSAGESMFEIYTRPEVETPDYHSMSHFTLHFAYTSEDIQGDFERLKAAGATVIEAPSPTPAGDTLAMLRDPWGVAVQLVSRKEKML